MEHFRVRMRMQLAEAHGEVNRYYCSQAYGAEVDDTNRLLCYFIKSGGAQDFARRYEEAMGAVNRWYCSEFYGYDVRDPEMLWTYYVNYRHGGPAGPTGRAKIGVEAATR